MAFVVSCGRIGAAGGCGRGGGVGGRVLVLVLDNARPRAPCHSRRTQPKDKGFGVICL